MYKENRPLWLKFSKENLSRFPDRTERYHAFLRECYPPTKPFSIASMERVRQELNLAISLDDLIIYGIERNWLTSEGKPYKNVRVFCTCANGVWLEQQRQAQEEFDLFF